jgi:protein required for attachment to host cells
MNLSPDAQAVISAELAKDYTNLPIDQIERRLVA